jgi:hypothetical protein
VMDKMGREHGVVSLLSRWLGCKEDRPQKPARVILGTNGLAVLAGGDILRWSVKRRTLWLLAPRQSFTSFTTTWPLTDKMSMLTFPTGARYGRRRRVVPP